MHQAQISKSAPSPTYDSPSLLLGRDVLTFNTGRHKVVDGIVYLPASKHYTVAQKVAITGTAEVEVWGAVWADAGGSAVVVSVSKYLAAYERATVVAKSTSITKAFGHSHVQARGNALVYAFDESEIIARDDALIIVGEDFSGHIELRGNAKRVDHRRQAVVRAAA